MYLCWKLALMMLVLVCVTESFRHPTRVAVSCCKEVSKGRIPPENKVTGYNHQNAVDKCVKAIIVYTDKGTFCCDPEADWIPELVSGLQKIQD